MVKTILRGSSVSGIRAFHLLQCLQSSLAQEGGANHWQLCITDLQTTLKTWIGRSKELLDVFEIVLRPIWWAAGCEQPSPPLPPPMVGGVLTKSRAAAASLALHQDFRVYMYTGCFFDWSYPKSFKCQIA